MTTTNVIAILLFILPGIIAEKISHRMDFPTGKKRNDFMEIINGISLSFPILFATAICLQTKYGFKTITQYIDKINDIYFLFEVCIYTLIASIIAGVIFIPIKSLISLIVNQLRKELNKMETDDESCWRKFLIDDNTFRYLEIIKDGVSYRGFMGPFSLPNESREIILETPVELLYNPDYDGKKLFTKIKGTYFDLEKNIVVHDYDLEDYINWYNEQMKKKDSKDPI